MNQYEWLIATPRSNSACTLGSQEVGKLSLPSFSSCWPNALQLSATVMPATSIRYFRFMGTSGRAASDDRRAGLLLDMNSRMDVCRRHRVLPFQGRDFGTV